MSIKDDLLNHPERLEVWRFAAGVSVICTETYVSSWNGESLGFVNQCYVANEYLPRYDYLMIPELGGYVNASRFKVR